MMTKSMCVDHCHKREMHQVTVNLEILPFPRKIWDATTPLLLLVGRP